MARLTQKQEDKLNGIVRCKDCAWYEEYREYCRYHNTYLKNVLGNCKSFKVKLNPKRDCTKCIHYNNRKNAKTHCKIGIYNCEGVKKC